MILKISIIVSALMSFATVSFAKSKKHTSHEGFCIINNAAKPTGKNEDAYQFICFLSGKVVTVRCELSGEGSNVQVGTWAKYGQNEGIEFKAGENNGNQGFMTCSKDDK